MIIIQRLQHHFRDRIAEWGIGYILMSWGLFLLLTPGAFRGSALPAYVGWENLASQNVWGLAAFTIGMLRLTALYVNGAHSKSPLVRTITGFASMFVWFWVTVGVIRAPELTTGVAVYPWLMLGDLYSVYIAAGDAYQARFRAKGGFYEHAHRG